MTDKQLVQRTLTGDRTAFGTLAGRYHTAIYNFILKMVQDRQDAADICQTVFLKAWSALITLQNQEQFIPWLYRIARNQVLDQQRVSQRAARKFDIQEPPALDRFISETDSPESQYEADFRCRIVKSALAQLPDEQREVLVLKVYQGLKFTEIAEVIQTPVNTVKSRLYYSFRNLRRIFKKWNMEEFIQDEL